MYRVRVENAPAKALEFLPRADYLRIAKAIDGLGLEPRPLGARKLSGRDGWRVRVGVYRILYLIDDATQQVIIYRIAHRREAYR